MHARRRTYRIETFQYAHNQSYNPAAIEAELDVGAVRHREVLKAIRDLHHALGPGDHAQETEELSQITNELKHYKDQLSEARKLKAELEEMYEAIAQTKQEIATLHVTGFQGTEMCRVTDELDAIVTGTEKATETILAAAEEIDNDASILVAKLTDETDQGAADDVQQQVIKIFEACNFQDLTGQRITKVVNTLRFIEERVVRMMEIWGGIDSFLEIEPDEFEKAEGDAALLNGPALETDLDQVSQDDIDALFD